jgi:hypothetical protein
MDGKLRPVRSCQRLPVVVNKADGRAEVLEKGIAKLSAHDQHFLLQHPAPHTLLYKDGSEVDELPEGGTFSVERYKEQIGKEFSRVILYIASQSNIG